MAGDVLRMTVFRKFERCASYQHLWYKSATTPSRKPLGANRRTIIMNEIYSQITKQFDFLISLGLKFTYSETTGKLGDRNIQKFTYDNPVLKKRFEVVYCTGDPLRKLFGFLIKYTSNEQNPQNVKDNISSDRLRCFFEEGSKIIFFGMKQYEFAYKLEELKLVANKFLDCITTDKWIDYNELLTNEKKIYVLTLEPKNYYLWADEIKSNAFIKKFMTVVYDASQEPSYEAYGLRLKSNNGLVFHITHGYKSRDEVGCNVQVIRPDDKTENYDFMNEGSNKVVEFIKQTVST
jgi:hypothetical protein